MHAFSSRYRWLATAALLAVAAGGCGSDDATGSTGDDNKATFNYIPLNKNTCPPPADDASTAKVAAKMRELTSEFRHYGAVEFKLCDTCTDNQFLSLLKSVTKPVVIREATDTEAGVSIAPPLADQVNKALSFPYRYLIVSHRRAADGSAEVVLGQGIRLNEGPAKESVPHFELQPQTLNESCDNWNISALADAVTGTAPADDVDDHCGVSVATSVPMTNSFGFLVPAELPALEDDAETNAALIAELPGMEIEIQDAEVSYDIESANCSGTGTITGWVQAGALAALETAGGDLKGNSSADGKVKIALQFSLVQSTVAASVTTSEAAVGAAPEDAQEVAPPPTVTMGEAQIGRYLSCTNCKALEIKQTFSDGKQYPMAAVLIGGSSGTFKVKPSKDDMRVYVSPRDAFGNRYASLHRVGSKATGEQEYKFQLRYRRSYRFHSHRKPLCQRVIEGTVPMPKRFSRSHGWMLFPAMVRGSKGHPLDRRSSILVCQTNNYSCGDNAAVGASGNCECKSGYAYTAKGCLPVPAGKCPGDSEPVANSAGTAVRCVCPNGRPNALNCKASPCDNKVCAPTSMCIIDEQDNDAVCEGIYQGSKPVYKGNVRFQTVDYVARVTSAGKNDEVGEDSDDPAETSYEAALDDNTDEAMDEDEEDAVEPPPIWNSKAMRAYARYKARRSRRTRVQRMSHLKDMVVSIKADGASKITRYELKPLMSSRAGQYVIESVGQVVRKRAYRYANYIEFALPLTEALKLRTAQKKGQLFGQIAYETEMLERRVTLGRPQPAGARNWFIASHARNFGQLRAIAFGRGVKIRKADGKIVKAVTVAMAVASIRPTELVKRHLKANPGAGLAGFKRHGLITRRVLRGVGRRYYRSRFLK